jgi:hypothetical protein
MHVEHRLVATLRPKPHKTRGGIATMVLAAFVVIASALGGYWLYSLGQSGTPTATDPGRIGVAVLGDPGSSGPLEVAGLFFRRSNSSTIQLTVTDLAGRSDVRKRVVVYLCGAIREGAEMTDLNRGALTLQPLQTSPIVADSRLGDRRTCAYAVDERPMVSKHSSPSPHLIRSR